MTLIELKAYAYDLIGQIQNFQQELIKVNEAIAQKLQEEQKDDSTTKE